MLHRAIAGSCLAHLSTELVDGLRVGATLARIEAGSIVRRGHADGPHFDLVVTGMLRVQVLAAEGRTLTVRYCRVGAVVGAATLFATVPTAFEVQALSPSDLLRFRPDVVRAMAQRDVRVALALLAETSERVLRFVAELSDSTFATVRARVCRHLLDLAAEGQAGTDLMVGISQQQLAETVGSVREVIVRVLRELRDEGLVETSRDGIRIVDVERLVRSASVGSGGVGT
jgi:CRP/FNR family cyclic AMP-dependent transcriptional regulator